MATRPISKSTTPASCANQLTASNAPRRRKKKGTRHGRSPPEAGAVDKFETLGLQPRQLAFCLAVYSATKAAPIACEFSPNVAATIFIEARCAGNR